MAQVLTSHKLTWALLISLMVSGATAGEAAVYGSTYQDNDFGVRQTIAPTARRLNIGCKIVMTSNEFDFRKLAHELRTQFQGYTVLLETHSDFVDKIVTRIHGDETRSPLDECDNLWVLTLCAEDTVTVLQLNFGSQWEHASMRNKGT